MPEGHTLFRLAREQQEAFAGRPDDFYARPDDLAEACWTLAHQPRSAWTFEMAVRPFGETW